jgi:CO/xanthine dehydrogenase FAD-binding subunit
MATSGFYQRPVTIEHAARLVKQASLLSLTGGFLTLTGGQLPFELMIDMRHVPELRRRRIYDEGVEFGSALTVAELLKVDMLLPVLRRALTRTLPRHLWEYLTLEDTLRARTHTLLREWLAALLALNASVEYHQFEAAEPRWEELERLNCIGDIELLTGLSIPVLCANQSFELAYIAPTPFDPAHVCAALLVSWYADNTVESARAAVCGASAAPALVVSLDCLHGEPLHHRNIARAVKAINGQFETDLIGSRFSLAQRQMMVKRCLGQALLACSRT